jgi:hypothetical protein
VTTDYARSLPHEHEPAVEAALIQAGPPGIDVVDLEPATGIRKRVLENVCWNLEQQGKAVRLASRPRLRYVAARWAPRS